MAARLLSARLLRETNICLTRQRMCLWEKGLTAQQTQGAEIRYSPAATDTVHTLTQESMTHTVPHASPSLPPSILLPVLCSWTGSGGMSVFRLRGVLVPSPVLLLQRLSRLTDTLKAKRNISRAQWHKTCNVNSSDYKFNHTQDIESPVLCSGNHPFYDVMSSLMTPLWKTYQMAF